VNTPDETHGCGCDDTEADTLRDMVAGGMGQWEASRRLWGPEVAG